MLKNYLKTASRNLLKHKVFSFINILGLSAGIACCITIWTYVKHELSYEDHFINNEKLFRVICEAGSGSQYEKLAVTSNKISPLLKRTFPEVVQAARFANMGGFRPSIVKYQDKVFQETKMVAADSTFLDLFPLNIIEGEIQTPLSAPKSVMISSSMARKYFGAESPIGKTLLVDNAYNFNITAIFEDLPSNSHFDFQSIISFNSHSSFITETWFPMNYYTYVELHNKDQASELGFKLTDLVADKLQKASGNQGFELNFYLQPLKDIYFSQEIRGDLGARMSKKNIYAIAFIGIFVLVIACINYINLTTAKSEKRAREVGIRKVMGATRQDLILQFYGETFLITITSLILGTLFTEVILPYFNYLINKDLSIIYGLDLLLIFTSTTLMITIISGLYPAIYLSSFSPIRALKSAFRGGKSSQILRKLLVVAQFSITSFLILGTLIIYEQLSFTRDRTLGFNQEETIVIPVVDKKARSNVDILRSELNRNADIASTTFASGQMGSIVAGYTCHGEGMEKSATLGCYGILIDQHFLSTLDLELAAGTDVMPKSEGDSTFRYIINERMAREMGWSNNDAINKAFQASADRKGTVVGVVKDFHFNSLRNRIEPLAMWIEEADKKHLYVKINSENHQNALSHIEDSWKTINPDSPFEFVFMDAEIQGLYESEQRIANVLLSLTFLSIIIGALGLFGLTAFVVERRTKEIGIRKVLGASIRTIMLSLSSEFMMLVMISFLIAFPIAYYFIDDWLNDYAYRISINILPFGTAALLALFVAISTVSIQTFRAAVANPVDALKEE